MANKPLCWGFCGSGKIAHDFATALSTFSVTEHKIIAVAGRNLERLHKFATTHRIQKTYDNYEALADIKNIDVVYVNLVNSLHYEISKYMIEHGKNVLVEKPMCMNASQTESLIKCARERKVFLMEGIWSRCFPLYTEIYNQMDNGVIGTLEKITINFGFPISEVERLRSRELGGGVTLDLGVYVLQFAQYMFMSDQCTITASGKLNEEGVDLSVDIHMSFPTGEANLKISAEEQLDNRAVVTGSSGVIEIDDFWCPITLNGPLGEKNFPLLDSTSHKLFFHNSMGLAYEIAEVKRCINNGLFQSSACTWDNSLLIAQWSDEIRRKIGVVYDID